MKFYKIIFSIHAGTLLLLIALSGYAFTQDQDSQQYSPENTIIAFDIHGVLVTYDKSGLIWPVIKNFGALRFFAYKGVREHLKNELKKNTPTPESYFLELATITPGIKSYFPGFFDIFNSYKPIPGMQKLLDDLTKAGYKLHIFSNIGEFAYHGWEEDGIQATGLKNRLTGLFEYFPDKNVVTNALKPKVTQYNEFEEKYPGKQIVFIDDRQENIDTSHQTTDKRFVGIRFHSPEQVRSELEELGILAKESKEPLSEHVVCP